MVEALKRRRLDGTPYERPPEIEAKLAALARVSRDELVRLCGIRTEKDPDYVPSECLMAFVRESRKDNSTDLFNRLYKLLVERVLRRLPTAESADGETTSLEKLKIRQKVFDRFVERIAEDRNSYLDSLDFFEIRFDSALRRLRLDSQEQVWREGKRTSALEGDTGEVLPEVEEAVGTFDPFAEADSATDHYRSRLDAAIDQLPREQIRIIEMLRFNVPIDSKDPYAVTIAKTLGKSEKTIRSWRDAAFETIRAHRSEGAER